MALFDKRIDGRTGRASDRKAWMHVKCLTFQCLSLGESPERNKDVRKQDIEKKARMERLSRIEMGSKDLAKDKVIVPSEGATRDMWGE